VVVDLIFRLATKRVDVEDIVDFLIHRARYV